MKVLVTGHQGYIGSVLVPVLRAAGHEVTGLDAGYYRGCTLRTQPPHDDEIRTIAADVRDVPGDDLAGFDAVVHLAALCNDPLGDLNADWTYDVNLRASVRLARLARDAGVERFVFASSCSVYGDAGTSAELTESTPVRPLTPYAVSKARGEEDIAALADAGFSPVFLRNGSVYGVSPRLRADIVLNNLVCWALTTGTVTMYTDGSPWRPLVHVEDVCAAIGTVLTAPRAAVHAQVFNVGRDGENYQVATLAELVREGVQGSGVQRVAHAGGDARDDVVVRTRVCDVEVV